LPDALIRAVRYSFDEAFASLWRGRRSGLLSTLTGMVALSVLGGVMLVTSNLQSIADEWSRNAEVSVYLQDDISGENQAAVERLVAPGTVVATYEFVSKPKALERFKQTFADLASTVATLDGNPLPASFEVRLQPSSRSGSVLDDFVTRLRAAPGVADVRYDHQWLDRLLSTIRVVRTFGLVLSAFLVAAAALTVGNVVRLALFARRDELEIMELIGAPQAFVKGPFVAEGLLQGAIGALGALVFLGLAFIFLRGRYLQSLVATLDISTVRFLSPGLCVLLLFGGMAVGCLGGFLASRKP
jgi:cell division transport system permease protein